MKKELKLVKQFHRKYHVPVADNPTLIKEDRAGNRHKLMASEVEEYLEGTENADLQNIAKELADILYSVYGTILEHGLQDHMKKVFAAVHESNMSKDYHQYKMIKGKNYVEADISSVLNKK